MGADCDTHSPADAKQAILDDCLRIGALVAGVADLEAMGRVAPAGHRPTDLMSLVRSLISLGINGQTLGARSVPAMAMAGFGSTETRACKIACGSESFIARRCSARSLHCPPDSNVEATARLQ